MAGAIGSVCEPQCSEVGGETSSRAAKARDSLPADADRDLFFIMRDDGTKIGEINIRTRQEADAYEALIVDMLKRSASIPRKEREELDF